MDLHAPSRAASPSLLADLLSFVAGKILAVHKALSRLRDVAAKL
jgi:hypothetical protein